MEKLRVKLLAFPAADHTVYSKGKRRLKKLFHQDQVEFVDSNPEVLVFLTGGSERIALESVQEYGFYLLLASADENSWAAATEVKAWMNQNNISSILVDQSSSYAAELIDNLFHVKNGLSQLKGKKFGLVGSSSDWLVNSNVNPFLIKTKLGVEQVDIPWSNVDIEKHKEVDADFINFFKSSAHNGSLQAAGSVYETLTDLIRKNSLDALTVECFTFVNSCNTTACLALSKLSMDAIPAGCEGDVCSMLGMMITYELFGIVPWQANVSFVKNQKVTFAHCTAPANILQHFELDTHFETGKGLALKGELKAEEVTILRLDHTLSKMFIAKGKVSKSQSKGAMCRTRVTVDVDEKAASYFINYPLGNHHLIVPGDYVVGFELACRMLRMELVS